MISKVLWLMAYGLWLMAYGLWLMGMKVYSCSLSNNRNLVFIIQVPLSFQNEYMHTLKLLPITCSILVISSDYY